MCEAEKALDGLRECVGGGTGELILFEMRLQSLVVAVRTEALEEAAVVCEDFAEEYKTKDVSAIVAQAVCHNSKHLAYRIRSLKGTAPQSPAPPTEEAGPLSESTVKPGGQG